MSIANNHIWDYGKEAFIDTTRILGSVGISFVGGGLNYKEAYTPVIKNIEGTRIAYLAYTNLISPALREETSTPAVAFLNLDVAISDIASAKAMSDIVVVSLHWGDEYERVSNEGQRIVARALIDAGASLVVGHHPHVVQEFVFDQNFSEETMEGVMLQATVKKKNIMEVKPIKIKINGDFQPFIPELE